MMHEADGHAVEGAEAAFWRWFQDHLDALRRVPSTGEQGTLDALQARLHAYCEALWFELGGHPDGPCEFIVTAEGDERHFDRVRRLVSAAPEMPGWKVIAFKPAHGFGFRTEYAGACLDPARLWFQPLRQASRPGAVVLRVAMHEGVGLSEEDFVNAMHVVVDAGLGELVASQRVSWIEACAKPEDPEAEGFHPLDTLDDLVGWLSRRHDC